MIVPRLVSFFLLPHYYCQATTHHQSVRHHGTQAAPASRTCCTCLGFFPDVSMHEREAVAALPHTCLALPAHLITQHRACAPITHVHRLHTCTHLSRRPLLPLLPTLPNQTQHRA